LTNFFQLIASFCLILPKCSLSIAVKLEYLKSAFKYKLERNTVEIIKYFNITGVRLFRVQVNSGVAKGGRGENGGTRPGAHDLGAHQHTFCSHLKTRFKQKSDQSSLKMRVFW